MINHISNIIKRIFSSEETIIFALLIIFSLIIFSFFASVLTPFIISIIFAYLLVGVKKKIEIYNISDYLATLIAFSLFVRLVFSIPTAWFVILNQEEGTPLQVSLQVVAPRGQSSDHNKL